MPSVCEIIENIPLSTQTHNPPWSYNDTQKSGGNAFFGASARYNTMNNKDICELPIQKLADKDCVLFLWATSPLLPEAFKVIDGWGFKYKTVVFCWNKQTKNKKWVSNMGRWTMGNIEICLLATKGHPKRIVKNIKQLVIAERKKHSQKPTKVRDRIVKLMGDLPRIELFARKENILFDNFEGWDYIGNDINGKDIRETLKDMIK